MTTLQQHGLVLEDKVTIEVKDHVSLKQQNDELRHVISEMRKEMEVMSSDVIKEDEPATIATKGVYVLWCSVNRIIKCVFTGYIGFMEKELTLLKAENRQLLDNLENQKLVKSHQGGYHQDNKDVTANQIGTLEAKLLEYSRTISKLLW